jgi:predicted GH43/DUF377 family glycosyl hydrolase
LKKTDKYLLYKSIEYHLNIISIPSAKRIGVNPPLNPLKIANLPDLERLFPPVRYSGNPILVHGGNGWKDSQINDPLIVPDIQNPHQLLMFFTGMAAPVATGKFSIGLATADITNPYCWTEYPSNPVFSPSSKGHWDDWWIWATSCHIINNQYYLFYIGLSEKKKSNYKIGLATSPDGLHWTQINKGKPILSPSKDEVHIAYPSLIHENNTWYMFYQWRDRNGPAGVRLATHRDGTEWSNWKKEKIPILSRGAVGSFDDKYIEGQQILKFGQDYVLLYHAFNGIRWTEGLAYSQKIDAPFTKSKKNPVFAGSAKEEVIESVIESDKKGATKSAKENEKESSTRNEKEIAAKSISEGVSNSWDGMHVSTSYLYNINNRWYIFYQGTNSKGFYSYANWDIGMAELMNPSHSTNNKIETDYYN